jgi:hypothetical protein
MSLLIETRQATLEQTATGMIEIRFKPGLVLDKEGLEEVLTERERLCAGDARQVVLAVFPADADFDMAVMTQDHYHGRPLAGCTKLLAVAANSLMNERMVSLYFAYFPQTFPLKVCEEEEEARMWLREQLAESTLS